MNRNDLARLLQLRRQREEKALNAMMAKQGQLARADAEVKAANEAASQHLSRSRDQERQRLSGLIGRPMRAGEIATLQSSLNAAADRHRDLVEAEHKAQQQREERAAELTTAQTEFHKRYRQAEKISEILTQRTRRHERRQSAIAESTTEEAFTDRLAGALANAPQSASRNGDA